ncbi:MAG: FAD-dependent oxidoreductase [Verrucomicrobiae bacterium]|nr:FAD-dependent oxidoreductase [Verrucomicrobiae bacterium]
MTKRVLIIGGGVIGLCAAHECARRGLAVTLLERNGADRDSCSVSNAGMVVPSHFVPLAAPGMVALGLKWMWNPESPFYIKPRLDAELFEWGHKFWRAANPGHVARSAPLLRDLSFASRAWFEDFAAKTGNSFSLVTRGLIMLCRTPQALEEEASFAARANQLGVPAQVLDAKQLAQLDPGVTMAVAGGVYFPKDCHLNPARFLATLQAECVKLGVEFSWNSEVTGWRIESGRIQAVLTSRGDFSGDEVVLCGGSWSAMVARGLGLKIPMQAGKGYSLTLSKPRQLPHICAILTEARVAVTPMDGALRVGGTMEIAGLNEDINPVRVQGIIKAVPKYYPEFRAEDFAGIPPWRGLRPCSPDGLPYIGRTGRFTNLTLATGHAMMGLSLAPVTGKLVGEIICGDQPSHGLSLLSPDRYA